MEVVELLKKMVDTEAQKRPSAHAAKAELMKAVRLALSTWASEVNARIHGIRVCRTHRPRRFGSWHGQRCAQVLEAEQDRARDEEKAREQQIRELKARARASFTFQTPVTFRNTIPDVKKRTHSNSRLKRY